MLSEAVELDAVGTAVVQSVFTAAFVPGRAKVSVYCLARPIWRYTNAESVTEDMKERTRKDLWEA